MNRLPPVSIERGKLQPLNEVNSELLPRLGTTAEIATQTPENCHVQGDHFFAVFDDLEGDVGSSRASQAAAKVVGDILNSAEPLTMREAHQLVSTALIAGHVAVTSVAEGTAEASLAFLWANSSGDLLATVGNAGSGRVYLQRDEELYLLGGDAEKEVLASGQDEVSQGGITSTALGLINFMPNDAMIATYMVREGDRLALVNSGVVESLDADTISALLQQPHAARALLEQAELEARLDQQKQRTALVVEISVDQERHERRIRVQTDIELISNYATRRLEHIARLWLDFYDRFPSITTVNETYDRIVADIANLRETFERDFSQSEGRTDTLKSLDSLYEHLTGTWQLQEIKGTEPKEDRLENYAEHERASFATSKSLARVIMAKFGIARCIKEGIITDDHFPAKLLPNISPTIFRNMTGSPHNYPEGYLSADGGRRAAALRGSYDLAQWILENKDNEYWQSAGPEAEAILAKVANDLISMSDDVYAYMRIEAELRNLNSDIRTLVSLARGEINRPRRLGLDEPDEPRPVAFTDRTRYPREATELEQAAFEKFHQAWLISGVLSSEKAVNFVIGETHTTTEEVFLYLYDGREVQPFILRKVFDKDDGSYRGIVLHQSRKITGVEPNDYGNRIEIDAIGRVAEGKKDRQNSRIAFHRIRSANKQHVIAQVLQNASLTPLEAMRTWHSSRIAKAGQATIKTSQKS